MCRRERGREQEHLLEVKLKFIALFLYSFNAGKFRERQRKFFLRTLKLFFREGSA